MQTHFHRSLCLIASLLLLGVTACNQDKTSGVADGGSDANVVDADTVDATSGDDIDDDGDGYTENQGDCDDTNSAIHPDADEICDDGLDNNCDGATDSDEPDVDGDGFGPCEGDCDDTDPAIHPDADEICDDGLDNNCNDATDISEPDGDGDGFGPCDGDCDDLDPAISPSASEIPDGVDNNCDGFVDADYDGDGHTVAAGDCDDNDPAIHPDAAEDCTDTIDNNCNGQIDVDEPDGDGDGYGPCAGDCNDNDSAINPDASEIAGDGIDNNCDGLIDEDIDGDGWTTADGDCNDSDPAIHPDALEDCNDGVDNDCNGIVDTDCPTPCELAEILRSSVGCIYYAIDTDQYATFDPLQFAVVVSNIDVSVTANVMVQEKLLGVWVAVQVATVPPGALHEFDLPDKHVDDSALHLAGAYRVVSDLPVIAYQFNPVDGVSSFSSDASLLLPKSVLDTMHHIIGYQGSSTQAIFTPQINVVAAHNGTSITITPSCDTAAGGGVPALTAGVAYTHPQTLDEGDYLQISGVPSTGDSFTGTIIESSEPVAVFSTHIGNNIPWDGPCCGDHLEEQMFGVQTWGQQYVAARMPVRNVSGTPEATMWHIYASEDNTLVSFLASPEVTGLPVGPQALNAGDWLEIFVSGTTANPGDFIVTADKAVHVMAYLTSGGNSNAPASEAGDPAMTQMVPVEQLLDSYVVLVPPNWLYDYLIISRPVGETIVVDGATVPSGSFIPIDDGVNPPTWEVARISVPDGVHSVTGTAPFAVTVVGYDSYDSYAYPGGLNQQLINPSP